MCVMKGKALREQRLHYRLRTRVAHECARW
jgi:hypothetical protein